VLTFGGNDLFIESRKIMIHMGEIYRYLAHKFGDSIELEIIDPRNSISFFALLLREKRVRKLGWDSFIHTALNGQSKQSIIINGQLFSKGELPSLQDIVARIEDIKQGVSSK
jgi:hypothetical protein